MAPGLSDALNLEKVKLTVGWQCHRRFPKVDVVKGVGEHSRATFQKIRR